VHASDAPPPISNGHQIVFNSQAFTGEKIEDQIFAAAKINRNPHNFHRLPNGNLVEVMPNGRELSPLENALRLACLYPPRMVKAQGVEVELAAREMVRSYGEVDLILLVRAGEYYNHRKREGYSASWIAMDWGKIKNFLEQKDNERTNGIGQKTADKLGTTIDARSRFSRA
jgi:hypothetical protein